MPCPNPCSRATSWAGQSQNVPGIHNTHGGSWHFPEEASDHRKTFAQDTGAFRAVSEGPWTFLEQHQTSGNGGEIIEIMKSMEQSSEIIEKQIMIIEIMAEMVGGSRTLDR